MLSIPLTARLAFVGLLVAGCGRVGVHLLPLDRSGAGSQAADASVFDAGMFDAGMFDAGMFDAGAPDTGAADGGRLIDAGATSDAAGDDAGTDLCAEAAYTPVAACGVGYCRTHSKASSCVAGVVTACEPSSPRSSNDATCDGIDDNCNGAIDENYAVVSQCGQGYCRTTSMPSRCEGGVETTCRAGAPLASDDTTLDGVDDDCDGLVDEDACAPTTKTYRAGSFSLSPPHGCTTLTVKLWAGGGASGSANAGYWMDVVGGDGGAGGYASSVIAVTASSTMQLDVGGGGKGCGAAGVGGIPTHNGGVGGTGTAEAGTAGADGSRSGGAGGNSSSGGDGGRGSFGGGGGGAGTDPGFAPHAPAGGGGAATVLIIGGTVSVIAGGGGGGGGAGSDISTAGHSGGNAGAGCSGVGLVATSQGGGGGGGGVCLGMTTQTGSGRTAYDGSHELASGAALGGRGNVDCDPGGDGYAIISFTR